MLGSPASATRSVPVRPAGGANSGAGPFVVNGSFSPAGAASLAGAYLQSRVSVEVLAFRGTQVRSLQSSEEAGCRPCRKSRVILHERSDDRICQVLVVVVAHRTMLVDGRIREWGQILGPCWRSEAAQGKLWRLTRIIPDRG